MQFIIEKETTEELMGYILGPEYANILYELKSKLRSDYKYREDFPKIDEYIEEVREYISRLELDNLTPEE